jgi:aspartate carbamoyltransferase catalytic subunit
MSSARTKSPFPHRHLLGIEGLSRPEIEYLLDMAEEAVEVSRQVEKPPPAHRRPSSWPASGSAPTS